MKYSSVFLLLLTSTQFALTSLQAIPFPVEGEEMPLLEREKQASHREETRDNNGSISERAVAPFEMGETIDTTGENSRNNYGAIPVTDTVDSSRIAFPYSITEKEDLRTLSAQFKNAVVACREEQKDYETAKPTRTKEE